MNIRHDMTDADRYVYFLAQLLMVGKASSYDRDVKAMGMAQAFKDRYGAIEPYKVTENKH